MKFKDYFFVIYYLLLVVVLQMQQSEVMPSTVIRLAYIAAVMWPLYSVKKDALPIVIGLFFTITNYNFSYSYMPYEVYQYDALIAIGLIFGYNKNSHTKLAFPLFLWLWFVLITFIDVVTEFRIYYISYSILGIALLWPYLKFGEEKQLQLMSYGIIVTSVVLSLSFIIFGKNYVVAYYGGGGFDREGWTDPNYFGCAAGMGIVASGIELLRKKNYLITQLALSFSVVVILACLATNASRGAILSVALSGFFLISLTKTKTIYKVLAAILIVVAIFFLDQYGYFDLLKFRIENDSNGGSGRTTIWANKLNQFFEEANIFNYLLGIGQEGGRSLALNTGISTGFHNDFVAFFCEYGVIGLVLYLKWLLYPIKVSTQNKGLVISIVIYIAACSFTLEPITAGRFTYFIFWIYAVMIAMCQNNNEIYNEKETLPIKL